MAITLPKPQMIGYNTSRCIADIMREREPEYEKLFEASEAGYEILGHYYIPPFQRPAVWTIEQQRRLIESIWLGISIGAIAVSSAGELDKGTGKYGLSADLLIDGQQRLRAIKAYLREGLRVFVGTPHDHAWEDLERQQQRKFEMTSISYIEIDRDFTMDDLKELYNRLNFGGTAHTEDQRA